MRDSLVFYRSFYEALMCLEDDDFNKAIKFVLEYALNEELPAETKGTAYACFLLIKPQIDANNKRFENGQKGAEFGKLGGRPKKTPQKPQKNPTKTPNVNVNVNENVNENIYSKTKSKNRFNNYHQNIIDYDAIENDLIANGKKEG